MNRYNILGRLIPLSLLVLSIVSCQGDISNIDELRSQSNSNKISEAEPTIIGVYDYDTFMVNDTPSPCIEAQMGQYLVVSGENLEGVTSLMFHGVDIDPADYYAQWDKIVMSVPYKLPEKDAISAMSCTTKLGSAEYAIDLAIPNIEISGVNNEFQLPGGTTSINGDYLSLCEFDGDDSKIYIEKEIDSYKKQVEVTQITDEMITITIPDDAPDNAYFTFEVSGVALTQKLHYRPTDLLLTPDSGSEAVVSAASSYATIVEGDVESDIENIFGDTAKYYRFKGSIPSGTTLIVYYVTDAFEIEDGKEASDYNLVYEINTKAGCAIPTGTTYKLT